MASVPPLSELEGKFFVSGVGVPHSRDTEIILHIDGESYFAAIHDAIAATNSSEDVIYIVSWLIHNNMILKPGTRELGILLHDKAALGVDVRIIVWTGRFMIGEGALDGESWWNRKFAAQAQRKARGLVENVQHNIGTCQLLRSLNPTGRPEPPLKTRVLMDYGGDAFGSRHQKYIIIYRKAANDLRAFVGGLDFFGDRMAAPNHPLPAFWHDAGAELRAGAAGSVWTDFRTRWEEARTLPAKKFRDQVGVKFFNDPAVVTPPSVPVAPETAIPSNNSVRVLRSYWPLREDPISGPDLEWVTVSAEGVEEILAVYRKALNNATNYIYVEDQWLNTTDDDIGHRLLWPLIATAANRGVKVIFIVPGNGDPADPDNMDNRFPTTTLLNNLIISIGFWNQVNFAMYRVNTTFVHSKVLMVDDEFVAVGSANFADRSMEGRDTELQAAIIDPSLVKDFRVRLWADHLGVHPPNSSIYNELLDTEKSLGIFRKEWGSGVSFNLDHSRLQPVLKPPA